MPFKFHEPRRHRVPKARHRVTNWPGYDRGLVGRGDLRLWIADEALAAWAAPRRRTRGGQARFSDLAIETVLVLASVFRLPLRQAEGFARSILVVMGLELPVPDHTTLARRRRGVAVESIRTAAGVPSTDRMTSPRSMPDVSATASSTISATTG